MIHYSCDRCKRTLDPHDEIRYVVRLETHATIDPSGMDGDDERDHLLEIHEILERSETLGDPEVGADVYQQQRFDLCPECYRKFSKNPVGSDSAVELNFSQN